MLPLNVLDTFKIENKEIYLKKFHCLRTYEAFLLQQVQIKLSDVQQIYDELEKKICSIIKPNEMTSVVFKNQQLESYTFEIKPIPNLRTPILLEISSELNMSGIGPQNFKWSDRSKWDLLQKNKKTDADEVIVGNLDHYVTETTRFNLFFYDSSTDCVYTPNLLSGCINGVYRRFVLDQGYIDLPDLKKKNIVQKNILINDIGNYSIYVANSVRGVLKACLNSKN